MGSDIVARWKDPLFATDTDAEGASPVGQIEVAAERGGLMPSTGDDHTWACCDGMGTSYLNWTQGCCPF